MKKIIVSDGLKEILLKERTFLSRRDFKVFTASSAEEMLRIHKVERADLIFADGDAAGMDAEALCSCLRKDERLQEVSVVLRAGDVSAVKRYRACGANAVLRNPVDHEELIRKITELLSVSKRGSLRGLIKVSVRGSCGGGSFFSVSHNISASGILLETEKVLSQGTKITCYFVLDRKITLQGEIVRMTATANGLYQYGVRFLDVDPESKVQIRNFVKSRERHGDMQMRRRLRSA